MQHCDSTCRQCFRTWVRWLKSREHQMTMPMEGMTTTFAEAAATSVRPPKDAA
jgi:hypothetical protein